MPVSLSKDQEKAVDDIMAFLADKEPGEMVLGGKAGTGKTFLTKYIVNELQSDPRMKGHKMLAQNFEGELTVYLTSTTNKAGTVLRQATGYEVTTIHRLLGLRVMNDLETGKTRLQLTKRSKIIERAIIVIDEASMMDKNLLQMVREQTMKCKVLYIGDPYQLAPVFETTSPVFSEIEEQTYLTKIQRQAAGSSIIQFADQFRNALDPGVFPRIASQGPDVELLNAQDYQDEVDKQFVNIQHADDARIVSWSNKRIHQYNSYIRALNNLPAHWTQGEFALSNSPIHFNGKIVIPTDGVVEIQRVDAPEIYDGIPGRMLELDRGIKVFQADNQLNVNNLIKQLVRDKNWRKKFEVLEFFSDLRPLYANTINKAQGSTYKNIFIDINDIGRNTQNQNIARLMYTAITRASDKVYMFGDLPARLYP